MMVPPGISSDPDRDMPVAGRSRDGSAPIEVTIVVDRPTVAYFATLLEMADPLPDLLDRATECADTVRSAWTSVRDVATEVLAGFGLRPWADECSVHVTPRSFRVGASNPGRGLIVYGQPERFPSFDGVVVTHEVAHIALFRATERGTLEQVAPAVDEALALLVEDRVLRAVTGAGYESVWAEDELDDFHRYSWAVARRSGLVDTPPSSCLSQTMETLTAAVVREGVSPARPRSVSSLLRERKEAYAKPWIRVVTEGPPRILDDLATRRVK